MSNPISPKVTASTVAAAVATLIVWGLNSAGIDVPTGVEGAFVVLLTFAAGYVVRDPQRENGPETGAQAPNQSNYGLGD